ncbi:hypothetical protein CRG98_037611 [Punica granatum]|uniref:Uncharacterized protein n=1 Tax=Punica granatum TaxID=22663 RepID=A0A2I0IDW8_PUNGR|nr:hypothetical protein CRG98_037611 [Punica granatum]
MKENYVWRAVLSTKTSIWGSGKLSLGLALLRHYGRYPFGVVTHLQESHVYLFDNLFLNAKEKVSSLQPFGSCSRVNSAPITNLPVQTLSDARARPLTYVRLCDSSYARYRARSCALRPRRPLHACMHAHVCTSARPRHPASSLAFASSPAPARALTCTPAHPAAYLSLLPCLCTYCCAPSSPERAPHAPEHPSKGSTESPDSQTLL